MAISTLPPHSCRKTSAAFFLAWIAAAGFCMPGCGTDDAPPVDPTSCNGSETLCAKRYDEVTYPTTHNAFSHADGPWIFPNQNYGIPRQLVDGARGLMIDVHPYDGPDPNLQGETFVCHATCWGGGEPLVSTLGMIKEFLDQEPNEVVTIIFESYVPREAVTQAFEESEILDYCYAHPWGERWPSLREMVSQGKRLVVFTDFEGGSPDWYHPVWDFAWETHFSARDRGDLTCEINRGDSRNDLFILNHFLTAPLARESLAARVNFNPFLVDRALQCMEESGSQPNFVTVDFYATGDLFEATRTLNGL